MNAILFEMFGRGFDVHMGPHEPPYWGFFAAFVHKDDTYQSEAWPQLWSQCGHGESLEDALRMARRLALGEAVKIPYPETFRE